MPKATRERDALYVSEHYEHQNLLLESAARFPEIEPDFFDRFSYDRRLQDLLPFLAYAQQNTEDAYRLFEDKHQIDLRNVQHPKFAVSGVCDPEGNCIHGVGNDGDKVNAALVLRVPDASIRYKVEQNLDENNGTVLTYAAAALYDLARAKGINSIMHMRTSGSVFMEVLYNSHKHGYKNYIERLLSDKPRMQSFVADPSIREFIQKGADLYKTVLTKGIKFYEELLIIDQQDRDKVSNTVARFESENPEFSIDIRLIRCMEIQQLLDDRQAIIKRGFDPENVIVVYQGQFTGYEFVYNPLLNRFIRIPNLEEDSSDFEAERAGFIGRLPPQKMWCEVADLLLQGARNYRRFAASKTAQKDKPQKVPNPLVVCCSDSRALPKFVIDTGANEMRVVLRNPGAFISREDRLMTDARRFLALANLSGESVIIAPHGNCGAQAAIDNFYEGDDVPPAFQDLAKHRTGLMRVVLNKGELPDTAMPMQDLKRLHGKNDIISHYREVSGIALKSIGDCLAVQQLLWDIDVIQREFPELHLVPVFQNMPECRNYVYDKRFQKFAAIPAVQPETPAKTQQVRQQLRSLG